MIPISEVVDHVEDWLELPIEDAVNLVWELITKEGVRVEDWDENDGWVLITDEQRKKTRVEDGKVQIGSKFVFLDFQDGERGSSHDHRRPAGTKTTAKAAREPRINWLSVWTAVESRRKAADIEERPARSPARLRAGRKPIHNRPEIDLEFGLSLFADGLPPDNNISELARRVWKRLEAKYGYSPDQMLQRTEMNKRAGVWMRAVLKEIEGGGS